MKTTLRRTAVALTAACALLLVGAAPASASTHAATTTGGTTTLTKAGQTPQVIDMTPDPTSGCPPIALTVSSSNTTPTGALNATITSTSRFFFNGTAATNHYIALLTGGTTVAGGSAGTYDTSTSPDSISSLTLRLNLKIYANGSTTCTPSGTPVCNWNVTVHGAGTFSGNAAAPASSDTALLNGASTGVITLGGACAAPFSTYTGGSVSVSNLGVHIT